MKMIYLRDLVPSVEFCRLIPKRCFNNSALVWEGEMGSAVWERDSKVYDLQLRCGTLMFPAPTLQEIMARLPKDVEYRFRNGLFFPCHPKFDPKEFADKKPEDAALKLWLKLKEVN